MTEQIRTIQFQGWRNIPHSYAITSTFKMLELLKRPGIRVTHRDVPYISPAWRTVEGLYDPATERTIRSIPAPAADEIPDVIYRITFPYDLSPSQARRTCVFGTAEFHCVPTPYLSSGKTLAATLADSDCIIATPSEWSRNGFLYSGADPSRVFNIGSGYDPAIFHPVSADERAAMRKAKGIDGFFFLTLGAMTPNKGMALLLKAFAQVAMKHPHVRLMTKGLGALYDSRQMLQQSGGLLTDAETSLVQERLHFMDVTFSFADIALLYQSLDAYVTPYVAEGFSMPVLEAAACGMPVICTAGGSTDDFTHPDFALRIDSVVEEISYSEGTPAKRVMPSVDHLIELMTRLVEDPSFAEKAHDAGPAFVSQAFTWKHIVDRLLTALFPQG